MSRNDKGYFFAEMLLSLAAFIMAASALLPYVLYVRSQIVEMREDADASHVLFDELMHLKVAGVGTGRTFVLKDHVRYQVTVKDDSNSPLEVCVHYESEKQQKSKCAFSE
jgi:competence protein ComGE